LKKQRTLPDTLAFSPLGFWAQHCCVFWSITLCSEGADAGDRGVLRSCSCSSSDFNPHRKL